MIHMNFVQIAEFDWLPWQHIGQIFEKILKIKKSSPQKP